MHCKMENKSSQNNKGCIGQILWKYIEQLKYTAPREEEFYMANPPRGPAPYPFICHFWQKGTPFIYLLLENDMQFTYLVNTASL